MVKSLMWEYFTPRSNLEAACNICGKTYGTKLGSTSTLKKHLAVHKMEYEEYSLKQAERNKASAPFQNKRPETNSGEGSKNNTFKQIQIDDQGMWNHKELIKEKQKLFDEAVVDWVAETGTPFYAVGTPGFKRVIKVANSKLLVKTPTTVSKYVEGRAQSVLSDVHDIISAVKHTVPSIGFTTDMWTSLSGDSYCSLTTSFIDEDFEMHRWVPFVKHFKPR